MRNKNKQISEPSEKSDVISSNTEDTFDMLQGEVKDTAISTSNSKGSAQILPEIEIVGIKIF